MFYEKNKVNKKVSKDIKDKIDYKKEIVGRKKDIKTRYRKKKKRKYSETRKSDQKNEKILYFK